MTQILSRNILRKRLYKSVKILGPPYPYKQYFQLYKQYANDTTSYRDHKEPQETFSHVHPGCFA